MNTLGRTLTALWKNCPNPSPKWRPEEREGLKLSKEATSFRAPWEVEFMAPGNGLDMGIEASCNPVHSQVSGLGSGGGGGVALL